MLKDDGDIVRGLGFVSMYSAWVEEDIDDILRLLDPVEPMIFGITEEILLGHRFSVCRVLFRSM